MIGWKCSISLDIITPAIGMDITSLNYIDSNVPWLISVINGYSPSNVTNVSPEEGYSHTKSLVGEDADRIYGVLVANLTDVNGTLLSYTWPSVAIGYPNLWEQTIGKSTYNSPTSVYIPGLNRFIVYTGSFSGSNCQIWSVENGKLINMLFSGADSYVISLLHFSSRGSGRMYSIPLVVSSGDYSDFSTYYVLLVRTAQSATGKVNVFSFKLDSQSSKALEAFTALMSNAGEPDWNFGPDNPYEPGGPSGPGGGDGSFDNDSDQIVDSSLPTLSSANTGFTRIYNPSLSQVQALARYLWTDESVIQTIWNHIKQYFEDPMQAIIGFNLVPVPVPNGGTQNFALMYIDTGVEMTVAASQFVDVDCGTFELKEYYGSALDYAPNTKVSCFLPFIGTVSLNTDEVMGRTLQVKYRVDICSGSCVAKIAVDGNYIYQYSGHCAINIPISSADFSSYVSSAISVAQLAAGAIAAGAGGLMASTAVDATQQTNQVVTTTQITNTARNPATGRQITTGTMTRVETRESPNDQSSTQASFSGLTPQNISNTVGQIMSSKPNINHSGSFSGNSGYLGVRRPFLIIERPNMCMPSNFQALNGFPSMITLELSSCKGFTRVQQVQLTGFYATNPEQAEILQLLKSGVIL